MKHPVTKKQFLYSILTGSIVGLLLLCLSQFVLNSAADSNQKQERLDLMNRFVQFQSNAEITIKENIYLLEGYMAYIETNPQLTNRESEAFLGYLLQDKKTLIRNIGILEDTTVIWNYPQEGNEEAIGVDLAKVENQKNDVLLVKEKHQDTFRGPLDLVQGGQGFIARLPLKRFEEYWGQISIVLDADQYKQDLAERAKDADINIAIYLVEQFPNQPFFGDPTIFERDGLVMDVDILNSHWRVVAEPIDGWHAKVPYLDELRLIAMIISLIIGLMVFMIQHTRHQLKYQAFTDPLTRLGNRHALHKQMHKLTTATRQMPVTVFMFDINSFKQINDRYGHEIGDQVLVTFADQLSKLPCQQKKVYRLGGDEFLVILIESSKNCRLPLDAATIRNQLSFSLDIVDPPAQIIPSVGIVHLPEEEVCLEKAIATADRRMYEDKDAMRLNAK